MKQALSALAAGLEALELNQDPAIQRRFERLLNLLLKARRAMNLVGPLSEEELVHELFLDSLQLARLGQLTGHWVDVGSGAGFPGIPLKIAAPQLHMTLVESRDKRHRFQGQAIRALGLEGIHRVRSRIEDFHAGPFDAACSKAFAPLDQWLPLAAGLVRGSGSVYALCSEQAFAAIDEIPRALKLQASERYRWGEGPWRLAIRFEKVSAA